MFRHTVYIFTCVVAILFCGCGGGSGPAAVLAGHPEQATEQTTDQNPIVSTALLEVRMAPQEPVEFPDRSASWLDPLAALECLPQPGRQSSSSGLASLDGAEFGNDLATNNVSVSDTTLGVFSPACGAGQPVAENMAYAIYRFDLRGVVEVDHTIALEWETPPADPADAYIGLADYGSNQWLWFEYDSDGVVTCGDLFSYATEQDSLLVTVVVLGTTECVLRSISAGGAEIRAAGVVPDEAATAVLPDLYYESLPAGMDLTSHCSPVGDQGSLGAGAAFAVASGALDYHLGQLYGELGWDITADSHRAAPRYLHVETGIDQGNTDPAGTRGLAGTFEWLVDNGCAVEANAPWDAEFNTDWWSGDWSAGAQADAQVLGAGRVDRIIVTGDAGISNLKTVLANHRRPVVIRTGIDQAFAAYASGVWEFTGPVLGYQALCLAGYDDTRGSSGAFLARNSWSEDWGEAGYCWISYENFRSGASELQLDGWVLALTHDTEVTARFLSQNYDYPPPAGLTVGEGVLAYSMELSWEAVPGAPGYWIYRDSLSNRVAEVGAVTNWSDFNVNDFMGHVFWVGVAGTSTKAGDPPAAGPIPGYHPLAPLVSYVTPHTGQTGNPQQFTASLSGQNPLSYSWNFGGGASPNESTDPDPTVTLGAAGTYLASLTVENPHGSDYIEFALEVEGSDDDWQMPGHDAQHTCRSNFSGPVTANLRWKHWMGDGAEVRFTPVIATDGTVYQACRKDLYAFNPDGTQKWYLELDMQAVVNPAVFPDGTILLADWEDKLILLNPDGTEKYSEQYSNGVFSPVIGPDGMAYINIYPNLCRMNSAGSVYWSVDSYGSRSSFLGSDGTIYTGSRDGDACAFNSSGELLWHQTLPDSLWSAGAVGVNGVIYLTCEDHSIYALQPDGTVLWSYATGDRLTSSPGIGADGTIYVGGYDGNFYALNPDGTLQWSYTTGGEISSSPAIDINGTIYFGSRDGSVYALNPDGTLLWSYATGDEVHCSPVLSANGGLYIGSDDGYLYAFGQSIPAPVSIQGIDPGTAYGLSTSLMAIDVLFTGTEDDTSTYIWDFGGGATPDTSGRRNPVVTLNAPGTYQCSVTVDNGYGPPDTLEFELTVDPGYSADQAWIMEGHDYRNTHCSGAAGPATDNVRWIRSSWGEDADYFPTIAPDGSIFAWMNCFLLKRNIHGRDQWRYYCDQNYLTQAAYAADGTAYVCDSHGFLHAVNPDGTEQWTLELGEELRTAPIIGPDNRIYATAFRGSADDSVYAVNPDGTLAWSYDTDNAGVYPVVIGANRAVYVYGDRIDGDYDIQALSPAGEHLWTYVLEGSLLRDMIVGLDGTIYLREDVYRDHDWIYITVALNPDGSHRNPDGGGPPITVYGVGLDGTLYGITDGGIAACTPEGTMLWTSEYGNMSRDDAFVVDNTGSVYYYDLNDNFIALDASGNLKWTYHPEADTEFKGGVVMAPDGTLHALLDDQTVIAFGDFLGEPVNSLEMWPENPAGHEGEQLLFDVDYFATRDETLTYSWDFDGGTTPATSSIKFPVVTLGGAGTYNCSVTVDNAYGPPQTAEFNLEVTAGTLPERTAWWMFGHDTRHSNHGDGNGPQTNNLDWSYDTGSRIYSPPAVGEDRTIYFGALNEEFYAVNPDGSLKWSYTLNDQLIASPAIARDGTIYAQSSSAYLYAFDPDGSLQWRSSIGSSNSSPALGLNGLIITGSSDHLVAVNPDGSVRWWFEVPFSGDVDSSPVIGDDGTIYFSSDNGYAYALNPDATVKWQYEIGSAYLASPMIGPDGTIYLSSTAGLLHALNPDGSLRWSYDLGDYTYSTPSLDSNGNLYIGCNDGNLFSLDSSGVLRWTYATGDDVLSSPVIGADDLVYFGSTDYSVYAVDDTGSLVWTYTIGDWISSSPVLAADGTLFVPGMDGLLYAIKDL